MVMFDLLLLLMVLVAIAIAVVVVAAVLGIAALVMRGVMILVGLVAAVGLLLLARRWHRAMLAASDEAERLRDAAPEPTPYWMRESTGS